MSRSVARHWANVMRVFLIAKWLSAAAGAEATRALIIDEGFGSLDDLGRQGMIDELHTLAGQLDRVIVVSLDSREAG
jgi:ABC-type proline/glycine betaine transport system ATPase subunit